LHANYCTLLGDNTRNLGENNRTRPPSSSSSSSTAGATLNVFDHGNITISGGTIAVHNNPFGNSSFHNQTTTRVNRVSNNNIFSSTSNGSSNSSSSNSISKDIAATLRNLTGSDTVAATDSEQCVVCLHRKRIVLFRPCKHCICCIECSRALASRPTCPNCRAVIEDAEAIFL
jgi:hypothetical protein